MRVRSAHKSHASEHQQHRQAPLWLTCLMVCRLVLFWCRCWWWSTASRETSVTARADCEVASAKSHSGSFRTAHQKEGTRGRTRRTPPYLLSCVSVCIGATTVPRRPLSARPRSHSSSAATASEKGAIETERSEHLDDSSTITHSPPCCLLPPLHASPLPPRPSPRCMVRSCRRCRTRRSPTRHSAERRRSAPAAEAASGTHCRR